MPNTTEALRRYDEYIAHLTNLVAALEALGFEKHTDVRDYSGQQCLQMLNNVAAERRGYEAGVREAAAEAALAAEASNQDATRDALVAVLNKLHDFVAKHTEFSKVGDSLTEDVLPRILEAASADTSTETRPSREAL